MKGVNLFLFAAVVALLTFIATLLLAAASFADLCKNNGVITLHGNAYYCEPMRPSEQRAPLV